MSGEKAVFGGDSAFALKVLAVTSGKGGVGKTTVCANLGSALAQKGKKVLLVDADIGLRNLDLLLGLENRIVFDVVDVVENKCRNYKQALIRDKKFEKLFLLPASQTRNKDAIKPEQMIELCDTLRQDFDYVLIDSPAGIEDGFKNSVVSADEAVIVTNPEISAVRDADRVIGLLESADRKITPHLVINRIKPSLVKKGMMLSIKDVQDILGIQLLGVVPDDHRVLSASNRGIPPILDRFSAAGKAFWSMAFQLVDEGGETEISPAAMNGGFKGFICRFLQKVLDGLEGSK